MCAEGRISGSFPGSAVVTSEFIQGCGRLVLDITTRTLSYNDDVNGAIGHALGHDAAKYYRVSIIMTWTLKNIASGITGCP